jgi:hypothetical protein
VYPGGPLTVSDSSYDGSPTSASEWYSSSSSSSLPRSECHPFRVLRVTEVPLTSPCAWRSRDAKDETKCTQVKWRHGRFSGGLVDFWWQIHEVTKGKLVQEQRKWQESTGTSRAKTSKNKFR